MSTSTIPLFVTNVLYMLSIPLLRSMPWTFCQKFTCMFHTQFFKLLTTGRVCLLRSTTCWCVVPHMETFSLRLQRHTSPNLGNGGFLRLKFSYYIGNCGLTHTKSQQIEFFNHCDYCSIISIMWYLCAHERKKQKPDLYCLDECLYWARSSSNHK